MAAELTQERDGPRIIALLVLEGRRSAEVLGKLIYNCPFGSDEYGILRVIGAFEKDILFLAPLYPRIWNH